MPAEPAVRSREFTLKRACYAWRTDANMVIQPGTPFPPAVKAEARKLAAFRCCFCRYEMGDDVHHLVPMSEGGQGVLDNAILLCVLCHDRFGHRADKRPQLRLARDDWYEIVRERYSPADVTKLADVLGNVATKDDIRQLETVIKNFTDDVVGKIQSGAMTFRDAAHVASSLVSSVVAPSSHRYVHPAHMSSIVEPPLTIRHPNDDPDSV